MSAQPSSNLPKRWRWAELIRIDGRAGRYQWWLVMALTNALMYLLLIPSGETQTSPQPVPERFSEPTTSQPSVLIALLVMTVFALCLALMFAVSVRRLHDRNKSGWWVLLYVVPAVGQIWLLVELGVLPGTREPNRYG